MLQWQSSIKYKQTEKNADEKQFFIDFQFLF